MKSTGKAGKERSAKGAGKKTAAGARPAKPGKQMSAAVGRTDRRGKDHWRALVETSAAWIWETDADIRHTYTNAFVTRCLGYRPAEFLGLNTLDLVHPDDRGLLKRIVQNVITRKEGWFDQVLRWRHKDGSWKNIESSGSGLFDDQGTFTGLCGVDRDVTEQIKAEDARRDSEARTRAIIEYIPVGMHRYRLEPDGRLVFIGANPAADKILGVDNSLFVGKTIEEAFPPLKATEVPWRYRDVAASGKAWHTEQVTYHDNAIHGAFEVHAFRTTPNSMVAAFQDITGRKRTEDALRQSETTLREAQQIAGIGSWRYDVTTSTLTWSDELYRIFDIDPADGALSVQTVLDRIHPDDREDFRAQSSRGTAHRSDYRIVMRDGTVKYIHEEVRVELDAQGRPARMYGTAQDITEHRRVEEALRRSKEILEKTLHSLDSAIFILDNSTPPVITDCNPAAIDIFGHTKEEMLGKTTAFLHVSSDMLVEFQKMNSAAIERQGFLSAFEFRMKRKNEEIFPSEHSVFPLSDDRGGRIGWVSVVRDMTERKRKEEALQENQARLDLALRSAHMGVWQWDVIENRRSFDGQTCRLLGIDQATFTGTAEEFFRAVHPEDREGIKAALARTLEQDVLYEPEYRVVWPDGSIHYITVRGRLARDPQGRPLKISGIIWDITDKKKMEGALRESEERYKSLIESTSDWIWEVDENARYTYASPKVRDLLGYEPREVVGKTPFDFMPREEVRRIAEVFTANVQAKEPFAGMVNVNMRKDGRPVVLETSGVPIIDAEGCFKGYRGIDRDITERKRAEETLRESERSITTLMGNLPGMAYRCRNDREWTMEYVSEGAAALTGYQPDDLIGNSTIAYNDLIHPDDQGPVWDSVQEAVERRQKYTLNYRIRTADGREKWVWEQGQGVFSEGGGLLALEGFIIDVSERRLLDDERLKTQKLESIGTLAGGIAHDFNNLLQGIFGYISMAKLTIDEREKSLAMLVQAEKALHQSVNLTSQLLTFSKGGKPVKKAIDLRAVIENAVTFALSGSRVDYGLLFDAALSMVEADEGQIGQVVQNIVLNAEQSMPLGGRIEIAVRNVPSARAAGLPFMAAEGLVEIVISDQGTGIPPEHLPRIFDPYFTTKEKGSGLGLATSYSIVKNHNGMISVSSELGKGSTFTVYLPATSAARESAASSVSTGRTDGRKGRILVMDDEQIVRVVAGELLRELGHEAEFAEHGDAAIEKYKQAKTDGKPFDVVILDLTIRGGKGGADTLREMQAIDPGVKAIVSSGYSDNEVVATFRQHGFCSFLKKPYDMRELSRVLSEVMA